MVWREPKNHFNDCYFCLTKIAGFTKKNKSKITYPNCESAMKPVPHDETNPPPVSPATITDSSSSEDSASDIQTGKDGIYVPDANISPHLLSQAELNDLVRDLELPKEKAELLGSRLQEWNLLQPNTKVSHFRHRHLQFSSFYLQEENVCFCHDISGLMQGIGCRYDPKEWRLFIDSSKASLKAVLLYNGNEKPSIPVAHATGLNETYESMKLLLRLVKYKDHTWNICGDLKVVSLLLGLQLGYTKHMCFLCLWNSRDDKNHYKKHDWPSRTEHVVGKYNVKHPALIDPQKVHLPPLHIKLGLMKNFVKGMDHQGSGFQYLKDKFKGILTDAKLEAGVFTGPQIRSVIHDSSFPSNLNKNELGAWTSFVEVVKKTLGNHKAENNHKLLENMFKSYEIMGCTMSLKIHYLHSHLDFFLANLRAVSDKHGERFHQQISVMENRYQGNFNPNMMGDYCWFLQKESSSSYK
jgi:hypothetical protein